MHPSCLPLEKLVQQCRWSFSRASGPGGQHRNKVETAATIEHLAGLYDRHIMVKKPTANMVKQAYRISWQAKIAAALMEQVVSYLVLKKPQAIVLMEFQAAMTAGGRIPGRPLDPEQLAMRERYFLEMRRLKGVRPKGLRSQAGSAADYPSAD